MVAKRFGGHVAERMCAVCRGRFPKTELSRHAPAPDDEGIEKLQADPKQVLPGRGIYVCSNPECVDRFAKGRTKRRRSKGVLND